MVIAAKRLPNEPGFAATLRTQQQKRIARSERERQALQLSRHPHERKLRTHSGSPLLDDQHVALHRARQVVGSATPNMLVNSRVARKADDQQIDCVLTDEIANYFHCMSGHNDGFNVHRMQASARPAVGRQLSEVGVGPVLLFAKFIDDFGMPRYLFLDTNHPEVCAEASGEVHREVEGLFSAVGAVMRDEYSLNHV